MDELKDFVKDIEMSDNIFVININDINKIDLGVLKSYLVDNQLDLVLTVSDKVYYNDLFVKVVKMLNSCGIDVYDMVLCKGNANKLEGYISSHDCDNVYVYENGNIVYRNSDEEVKPKRRG